MTDNVVDFTGVTYGKIPARKILEALLERADEIDQIMVITSETDGQFHIFTSEGEAKENVYLAHNLQEFVRNMSS